MRPLVFKSHYTNPYGYLTSWSRHTHNVLINGYMARELDADDFEFLEKVKVRGIANGELPNTSVVSLEELEFWDLPYDVQPGIERRLGPVPRPITSPEEQALRLAKTNRWHARRAIREQERAIAAAELERERVAWIQANENRKRQDALTDAEWEAADPWRRPASFGRTVGRHYVPQWKIDEGIEAAVAKFQTKKAEARHVKAAKRAAELGKAAEAKRQAEATDEAYYERGRRLLEAEPPGPPAWLVKARHLKAKADARAAAKAEAARVEAELAADARARAELAKAELERRNAIIAEARRTVDEHTRFIAEQQAGAPAGTSYTFASLKQAMMTLIRASRPHVWRREALANTLGCDRAMLDRCADELVRDGFLHWREPADAQG